MKNKDYVASKKKQQPEKPSAAKPFPTFKLIIVGGLILAFVYFLFFIDKENPEADADTKAPTITTKPKPQAEIPPLPEDEEWQFIEELENKKVEVDAEELEDRGPFLMQCASFRSKEQAEELKVKILLATHHESEVRKATGTTGVWYKVVLGPFEKKRDAERSRQMLKKNGVLGCQIWLWR